jgi:hypothetical protein
MTFFEVNFSFINMLNIKIVINTQVKCKYVVS